MILRKDQKGGNRSWLGRLVRKSLVIAGIAVALLGLVIWLSFAAFWPDADPGMVPPGGFFVLAGFVVSLFGLATSPAQPPVKQGKEEEIKRGL